MGPNHQATVNEVICILKEVIAVTAEHGHPFRGIFLFTLANALAVESGLGINSAGNLDEAVKALHEVLELSPDDHLKAAALELLSAVLSMREHITGSTYDTDESKWALQKALRLSKSQDPKTARRLLALSVNLLWKLEYIILDRYQEAYEVGYKSVHLLSKMSTRSLSSIDKQRLLNQAGFTNIGSNVAAVALLAGESPLAALNVLELGRGVVAASINEMYPDLGDLRKDHPFLADQFERVREELDGPTAPYFESSRGSMSRRVELGKQFDAILNTIRQQIGFEKFLHPLGEGEVLNVAEKGPIVVINVSYFRYDAILIETHQVRVLPLPNLHTPYIEKRRTARGGLDKPKTLTWLWEVVAEPVLDALGFTEPSLIPSIDGAYPHVWWILTGGLASFPMHAAGRHRSGYNDSVMDRVMSSYSSSVRAIISGRRRKAAGTPSQALLVAMRDAPGGIAQLPHARAEVDMLAPLCAAMGLRTIEPTRHRTEDVLKQLLQCEIFHFAGHGHTSLEDPLASHLLLEDWKTEPLTVARVFDLNLRVRVPFLAYLSACSTGKLNQKDSGSESVHMISGFQLAGFRHVIGTLWEVNDELCVDIARITYEGMRDGGMTDESVCKGLHMAILQLREQWM
ncbi:hypothetical protein HD806DRAFT_526048 [Xylariaceae sp. AK1471]|nr:hypothetical protein HD806DRAFT_526048 [Xylariaceae sp. AK1471]